ncbi:YaeQ family protein [soil metagenome]
MGNRATLYRFRIELSDVDRGIYEPIDFRAALHPSETARYMITRALAFALNYQEGIEFAPGGISDTEEPAIRVKSLDGRTLIWIEIGNPAAKKLHKASKSSPVVKVYAHKDPSLLADELAKGEIHRGNELELFSFSNVFLNEMEAILQKENKWSLMHTDGSLTVTSLDKTAQGEVRRHPITK